MRDIYQQLVIRLFTLEAVLHDLELWSEGELEPHRLRSTAPFACDLLSLPEWLQYVFLPRMQELVHGRLTLPEKCEIEPYARECFAGQEAEIAPLFKALADLDTLISEAE